MKSMMMFSVLISSIFMKINNPMMMVIMIILQTLTVCLILWLKMGSSWFSYILFLIFMGGLMVLFIYICSLASNEMFFLKLSYTEMMIIFIISMMMLILTKNVITETNLNYSMFIMNMLMKMNMFPVILTMFYLLFTLIVVVKISNKKLGPIRTKKN